MTTRSPTRKSSNSRPRKAATRPRTPPAPPSATSKLDQLAALLARPDGASIAEMMAATGWQPHSVRGALAGALKRRGLAITSDRIEGVRRYRTGDAR
jgi:hypothetical protein